MKAARVACALMVIVAGVACNDDEQDSYGIPRPIPSPTSSETRIIGLVGSSPSKELGAGSAHGDVAFEGAHVGIGVLNRGLPEGEAPFELVSRDDRGDPALARQHIVELLALERLVGIVYAGPDEALRGIEGLLARAGVPLFACFADLYTARLLSPHLFQVAPPFLWQARRIAAYIDRDRRYSRIGLLRSRTLSGATAEAGLRTALGEAGIRLARTADYADGSVAPALRRLRKARVQAVVIEGSPRTFSTAHQQLRRMRGLYRNTRAARASLRRGNPWRPHVLGFDLALDRYDTPLPAGTAATDTYARGDHYLPIRSLRSFRAAYRNWWDEDGYSWQRRAYEAVQMIGWAATRATPTDDLARVLERIRRSRFGGLDVTFGPDDHTSVEQTTVGLWVVPRRGVAVAERRRLPEGWPWVPLARGFSIDGERTDVLPRDWKWLFRNAPPPRAPAPKLKKARFGVATPRSDPIH